LITPTNLSLGGIKNAAKRKVMFFNEINNKTMSIRNLMMMALVFPLLLSSCGNEESELDIYINCTIQRVISIDWGAFQIVARFQKIYLPLFKSNNKK